MSRASDKRLRVAITGFAGLEEPGPGAAVAQSLRAGWKGALELSAWTYGGPANSALLPAVIDRAQVLPSLDLGDERLFAAIVEHAKRSGIDVILPGDADALSFARLAPRLAERGLRVLLPPVHRVDAITRANLPKFLHDQGFAAPLTVNVSAIDEIAAVADRIGYPLYVRGLASGERLEIGRAHV